MEPHPTPAPGQADTSAPSTAASGVIDPRALARHRLAIDRAGATPPWLHSEVARRMADRLTLIKRQPQRVLDWWSANGASTELLARHCPTAVRLPSDAQGRPISAADAERPWWRRWLGGDSAGATATATATAPVDLLWANMMLHWVEDLPGQFAAWHEATAVDGFLMFSCFGPDTVRALHALYAEAGYGSAGSPCIDMHDIGDALVQAGFADPVMDMETLTLTWADAGSMLAELRTLGRNTAPDRHAGLRTPRWRQALIERLNRQLRQADGRLHLRFELIYGHAFRVASRAKVAAETQITLAAMREMTRRRNPQGH